MLRRSRHGWNHARSTIKASPSSINSCLSVSKLSGVCGDGGNIHTPKPENPASEICTLQTTEPWTSYVNSNCAHCASFRRFYTILLWDSVHNYPPRFHFMHIPYASKPRRPTKEKMVGSQTSSAKSAWSSLRTKLDTWETRYPIVHLLSPFGTPQKKHSLPLGTENPKSSAPTIPGETFQEFNTKRKDRKFSIHTWRYQFFDYKKHFYWYTWYKWYKWYKSCNWYKRYKWQRHHYPETPPAVVSLATHSACSKPARCGHGSRAAKPWSASAVGRGLFPRSSSYKSDGLFNVDTLTPFPGQFLPNVVYIILVVVNSINCLFLFHYGFLYHWSFSLLLLSLSLQVPLSLIIITVVIISLSLLYKSSAIDNLHCEEMDIKWYEQIHQAHSMSMIPRV